MTYIKPVKYKFYRHKKYNSTVLMDEREFLIDALKFERLATFKEVIQSYRENADILIETIDGIYVAEDEGHDITYRQIEKEEKIKYPEIGKIEVSYDEDKKWYISFFTDVEIDGQMICFKGRFHRMGINLFSCNGSSIYMKPSIQNYIEKHVLYSESFRTFLESDDNPYRVRLALHGYFQKYEKEKKEFEKTLN